MSVFSQRPRSDWVAHNELAFALRDAYPVAPGHTLVIPRREIATWFEATAEEKVALFELVDSVKAQLDQELSPQGYNVGFNAGAAAGQTVPHLHVHVIPRYQGDVPDPRGGIRHVIPGKGNYLVTRPEPLATGGVRDPFLAHLRPLFRHALSVEIVAAFVQDSGLLLLHDEVHDALRRGCRVRLVTGDYLALTQEGALRRLLAWEALGGGTDDLALEQRGEGVVTAGFSTRVVETARLDPPGSAFHPKAWIFEGPAVSAAFVGSSNVSRSALADGVEWNLRTEATADPVAWGRLRKAFEELWAGATQLTPQWVSDYAARARMAVGQAIPGEVVPAQKRTLPAPHPLQKAGLAALARARRDHRGRALVVMATGLGKTWLAAFDLAAVSEERGRFPRVLFLAHRAEILEQASETMGLVAENLGFAPCTSWYAGSSSDLGGDLVLASVQKLARPEGLARLAGQRFDHVVVDEVHHAAAASYRRVLDSLDAGFVLGLTATPDRADEADILGLFDEHVAYEAGLGEGIGEGLLVPFTYYGLRDTVEYANIPWRNRRFDPEMLAAAAATEERMSRLWEAWQEHPASRTLVFCCSVDHASFVERWLAARGTRVRSVTASAASAERSEALAGLRGGQLDALCAVDLFNEGVDIPPLDRVVMLRPTESPVIFVQQLGRGLRKSPGKAALTVIDFVGNHRVFLDRIRLLLSLGRTPVSLRSFLETGTAEELPPGCSVQVELEAVDLLRRLLPRGDTELVRAFRELKAARGERPTAGEIYRLGYTLPRAGWFAFLAAEGDLTADETQVVASCGDWFADLQTTHMEKSFKMVLVEALLESGSLRSGLDLRELARRSHRILARSPELLRDLSGVTRLEALEGPSDPRWLAYWRENPVRAWTQGPHGRWFHIQHGNLAPRIPVPDGLDDVFESMTRELVDVRLAQYRRRSVHEDPQGEFVCKLIWNRKDPILKLPSRSTRPDVPFGEHEVCLPDGSIWTFRFAREYCNVARPVGRQRNELPDLLRGWFGPGAGKPGTAFHVRFSTGPEGRSIRPDTATEVLAYPSRSVVTAYPSLRAAAGAARRDSFGEFEQADESPGEVVALPIARPGDRLFAVRASGSSMDGGPSPIRDGDWVVLRWARGEALKNLSSSRKIALVETAGSGGDDAYQLKRIVREGGRWLLRSDNPDVPDFDATDETVPIATHVQTVRPEQLAPTVGESIEDVSLAKAFGLEDQPRTGRTSGHLFILIAKRGVFTAPDRIVFNVARRPAETAFVLARPDPNGPWRYCGVGRWIEEEGLWAIPKVDGVTWDALGGAGRP